MKMHFDTYMCMNGKPYEYRILYKKNFRALQCKIKALVAIVKG